MRPQPGEPRRRSRRKLERAVGCAREVALDLDVIEDAVREDDEVELVPPSGRIDGAKAIAKIRCTTIVGTSGASVGRTAETKASCVLGGRASLRSESRVDPQSLLPSTASKGDEGLSARGRHACPRGDRRDGRLGGRRDHRAVDLRGHPRPPARSSPSRTMRPSRARARYRLLLASYPQHKH
jgi:hypothetical protein